MFFYLSQFKDIFFAFNIFRYITFRAAMAAVTTFLLCMIFGPVFTRILCNRRIKEKALREDCPDLDKFQNSKHGTPTMGGLFVIGALIVSILLWTDLSNRYILLTLATCCYMAFLGFIDDWIKLKGVGRHRGLRARNKLFWQVLWGALVGMFIFFDKNIPTTIDIPFLKDVALSIGIFYIPLVALIIVGTTNAVNLTDGLDGLAVGCIFIVSGTLAILCYITGNVNFSGYLFVPYITGAGELTIVCSALAGASLGFLWFNCHPASVFMGDTGSLSLGGTLAVMAVLIKKELLLVLLGGIFVIEALSVILQVFSFKLFRKRILKMSPLHHHLQMCGWPESKITIRFWIIGILLAVLTLMTLKVR